MLCSAFLINHRTSIFHRAPWLFQASRGRRRVLQDTGSSQTAAPAGETSSPSATASVLEDGMTTPGSFDFSNGSSSSSGTYFSSYEARTGAAVYWDNTAMVGDGVGHQKTSMLPKSSIQQNQRCIFSLSFFKAPVVVGQTVCLNVTRSCGTGVAISERRLRSHKTVATVGNCSDIET